MSDYVIKWLLSIAWLPVFLLVTVVTCGMLTVLITLLLDVLTKGM